MMPMFPEPEQTPVVLSRHFQSLRSTPDATWKKRSYRAFRGCDECYWLQHETDGAFHPRRKVAWQRMAVAGTVELCTEHARLWKEST